MKKPHIQKSQQKPGLKSITVSSFDLKRFITVHWQWILLVGILLIHIFFRVYLLSERISFGYDQVDNAWAVKQILVDHKMPLLGMVAKGNSGFNIGPAYYYIIAPVYAIFNLDPIASPIIAVLTSIFTFWVLFFVIRKLFSFNIALAALFINAVSFFVISGERIQWPVDFIVPISAIIFYALYKVIEGKGKYLLLLSFCLGFSLHIHFTSVFYPIIILFSLPFFPWKKENIKYIFYSILIFLLFLSPIILSSILSHNAQGANLSKYLQVYYHGIHLVRVLQLTHDAFIEFVLILQPKMFELATYFLLPLFIILYFLQEKSKKRFLLCYLMIFWFLVPWIVFSTYSGEITNYYFYLTRPMVLMILGYFIIQIFSSELLVVKGLLLLFLVYFSYINIQEFFIPQYNSYKKTVKEVKQAIKEHRVYKMGVNTDSSYLYYFFSRKP